MKSLLMWKGDGGVDLWGPEGNDKFYQLEHLGGIYFSTLAHLPALKYVQGTCMGEMGFNNFCEHHPNLEILKFVNGCYDSNGQFYEGSTGHGDWTLPCLKTIVYSSDRHSADFMRNLVEKCMNIQELHLVNPYLPFPENDFLSQIRFHQLKMLSFRRIYMPFGSPDLVKVFEQCPKLERLHLMAQLDSTLPIINFGTCLKTASKLRELRLECRHTFKGIEANIIMLFQYLVEFSPKLERLVLHGRSPINDDVCWESQIDLGQQLVEFLSKMKCLIAFSFTGYNIQPNVQEAVHGHVDAEIRPDRPSFWFHLGKSLPKANDPDIPRIHYDEIVNPIDPFHALPQFE